MDTMEENDISMESDVEEEKSRRKSRKRIIDDSDDEEPRREPSRESINDGDESKEMSIKHKNRIIDDDSDDEVETAPKDDEDDDRKEDGNALNADEDLGEDVQNTSKKVIYNLQSLCDEDSSSDEERRDAGDDDEQPNKHPLGSTDESSQSQEGPTEHAIEPKAKNPQRKAKTEAENVISMIQKNAREEELSVPYHCPEQKSLKEFLESLKSSKSKLIVEEKVEMKTHKFKLLKDVPQLNLPPRLSDPTSIENQNSEGNFSANHHLQAEGTEKVTLKGDRNFMIDLETGQTYKPNTVADTLISNLFRNNRTGRHGSNDPKFKPEPIPGAPLKALKRSLECELERKRKETILKILEVEKVEKDDEEEILDDEEFELDSDDDAKKRRVKKKKPEIENEGDDLAKGEKKSEIEFNDEEMEENEGEKDADDGDGDDVDPEGEEDADPVKEENSEDESAEEGGDEEENESDSGDELEDNVAKKPLRRIVAMDDSDEEVEQDTIPPNDPVIEPENAPLFDDIPTEAPMEFSLTATQNDDELFALCSGKFTTQLPIPDEASQSLVEASQVRDFEFPSIEIPVESTQKEISVQRDEEVGEEEIVAGPQQILSSSEDEANEENQKKEKKVKRKKKKILIAAADDSDEELAEEEAEDEEDDQLPEQAIEELAEYKSFLTGKPVEMVRKERYKVTDFLEKEAELSDSEWGSEDEDERGLDRLEDIGLVKDDDEFDGEQLRDEVGRIHMRQMVNEDNRELKYLKDLILNEEELDGQGRQRTFRWLNVNNENEDFGATSKEGEDGAAGDAGNQSSDDEENEATWRKLRLEREQALLGATKDNQNVTIQSKLEAVMRQTRDIKVVKPASSGEMVLKENSSPSFLMQEQSKKYMNLRQSFLLRDEETLNRLATFSAKADGASGAVSDGKQNFVFRRIEEKSNPPVAGAEPPKKRKSNTFTPSGSGPQNPYAKKRKV